MVGGAFANYTTQLGSVQGFAFCSLGGYKNPSKFKVKVSLSVQLISGIPNFTWCLTSEHFFLFCQVDSTLKKNPFH